MQTKDINDYFFISMFLMYSFLTVDNDMWSVGGIGYLSAL